MIRKEIAKTPSIPEPDYGTYLTESRSSVYENIDEMETFEIVRLINDADKTVAYSVEKELPHIAEAVDGIAERLRNGGRLFYVGAGTSGRLGVIDAAECPPTYGVAKEMVQGIIAGGNESVFCAKEHGEDDAEAGILALKERNFSEKDVCFGLSASGSAAFVRAAIGYAHTLGALTVLLCCNPTSPAIGEAEIAVVPAVGPEIIAGSTRMKAATAQKMVLTMVSTAVMVRLGRVRGNRMVYMKANNRKLHARAVRMITDLTGIDAETAQTALEANNWDTAETLKALS